jgi:cytochrome c oxidase subunit 2
VRFRGRPGDPDPPQVAGNRRIEIIWTSGAFVLVLVLFVGAVVTMQTVSAAAPAALRVRVIGHQWWWEYQYPDLGITTANELHLPSGESSQLEITSADVIHSFWVPQLGWKQDANPGQTHAMWVRVDQPGTLEGACAEYCGTEHAWMRIRVMAESRDQFDAWVRQQQQPATAPPTDLARQGQQVFESNTCVNCHTIQGTSAQGRVSPDLTHFGSRSTVGAGVAANMAGRVPLLGDLLAQFITAGQTIGGATLTRFYATHVFLLPALIFGLLGIHLYLSFTTASPSRPGRAGSSIRPATRRTTKNSSRRKASRSGRTLPGRTSSLPSRSA